MATTLVSYGPMHRRGGYTDDVLASDFAFERESTTLPLQTSACWDPWTTCHAVPSLSSVNLQTSMEGANIHLCHSSQVASSNSDQRNTSEAMHLDNEFLPENDIQLVQSLLMGQLEDVDMIDESFEPQLPQHAEKADRHASSTVNTRMQDQQVESVNPLLTHATPSADWIPTTLVPSQRLPGDLQSDEHTRVALSGPSSEDWEIHRPIIEQLYIKENVKLKDVQKIMKESFDFMASEKMYKTRITQWDLRKNYTISEKKEIIELMKTHNLAGRPVPIPDIRGRKTKMNRIRRYCRQEKILEEVAEILPRLWIDGRKKKKPLASRYRGSKLQPPVGRPATISLANGEFLPWASTESNVARCDPERPFSLTSELDRIEIVLLHTRMYFDWSYLRYGSSLPTCEDFPWDRAPENAPYMSQESYTLAAFNRLQCGVGGIVRKKPRVGWQLIYEACEMLEVALHNACPRLVGTLLSTFGDGDWEQVPELRAQLLRYITRLLVLKHGCYHPLSIASYHLLLQPIFAAAAEPAYNVMIKVAAQQSQGSTSGEVFNLRIRLCVALLSKGRWTELELLAHSLLQEYDAASGSTDWRTRSILWHLGVAYLLQGKVEEAELVFRDAAHRGLACFGNGVLDATTCNTVKILSWLHAQDLVVLHHEFDDKDALMVGTSFLYGRSIDEQIKAKANSFKSGNWPLPPWLNQLFGTWQEADLVAVDRGRIPVQFSYYCKVALDANTIEANDDDEWIGSDTTESATGRDISNPEVEEVECVNLDLDLEFDRWRDSRDDSMETLDASEEWVFGRTCRQRDPVGDSLHIYCDWRCPSRKTSRQSVHWTPYYSSLERKQWMKHTASISSPFTKVIPLPHQTTDIWKGASA